MCVYKYIIITHTHTHTHMCVCVCMYILMYVYLYLYMYIVRRFNVNFLTTIILQPFKRPAIRQELGRGHSATCVSIQLRQRASSDLQILVILLLPRAVALSCPDAGPPYPLPLCCFRCWLLRGIAASWEEVGTRREGVGGGGCIFKIFLHQMFASAAGCFVALLRAASASVTSEC